MKYFVLKFAISGKSGIRIDNGVESNQTVHDPEDSFSHPEAQALATSGRNAVIEYHCDRACAIVKSDLGHLFPLKPSMKENGLLQRP